MLDDDGGGEIGHEVRVGLIELEDGGEALDRTADWGGGDGAGEFEVRGEREIGIGVEVDDGFRSLYERGAIGFADLAADEHFGGIENRDNRLASIELIAFLRLAHRVVAVDILEGHHSRDGGVDLEL